MFFYLTILLLAAVLESNGQNSCQTHLRTQGNCTNINGCASLLNLLMQPRPLPDSTTEILRKSHCGFDRSTPKVCCPLNNESVESQAPIPDVSNHPNVGLINGNNCGRYSEPKIFGGNKTEVLEFPWMALIAYDVGRSKPEFKCGGSLISKRYVLTAAHCVTGLGRGIRLSKVRLGEHDLSKERDCDIEEGVETVCAEPYQDFLIESVHSHAGYSREKLRNDIALIKLNGDANFERQNVRPICLPLGSATVLRNKKVIVTGWGTTETGTRSQDLLKVQLPVVPTEECTQVYKAHKVELWYKQLCAGGSNRMDSCSGDSGGPMQAPAVNSGLGKYFQYGVVSFGSTRCGIEGFPGVYTNVAYYMDWILDNITN